MKFTAEIDVMPKKELLDPQGKAVMLGLEHLGLSNMQDVRVGKHITVQLEAADEAEAKTKIEDACKKLLANLIMESYKFEIHAN